MKQSAGTNRCYATIVRSLVCGLFAVLCVACGVGLGGCTDVVNDNGWELEQPQSSEQSDEDNQPEQSGETADCADGVEPGTEFEQIEDDVWKRTLPPSQDDDAWYQATVEIDASAADAGDWTMELTQRFCHESEDNKALVGMRPEGGSGSEEIPEQVVVGQPEWIYPASPGVSSEGSYAFVVGCTEAFLDSGVIPMTDVHVELEPGKWHETDTDDNRMGPLGMHYSVEQLHHGVERDPGENYHENAVDYGAGELNMELYWPRMHRGDKKLGEEYWSHRIAACEANEISHGYRGNILERPDPQRALVVQTVPAGFPDAILDFFEELQEQE